VMRHIEVSRNYHRFVEFRFHLEYMLLEVCVPFIDSIVESQQTIT